MIIYRVELRGEFTGRRLFAFRRKQVATEKKRNKTDEMCFFFKKRKEKPPIIKENANIRLFDQTLALL